MGKKHHQQQNNNNKKTFQLVKVNLSLTEDLQVYKKRQNKTKQYNDGLGSKTLTLSTGKK